MGVNIQLTTHQINQIASSILLTDVKTFVDNHKEDYEKFLEEEQNTKENFTNNNSVWTFYTNETICKVNIDKNTKGSEQKCNLSNSKKIKAPTILIKDTPLLKI